MTRLVSLQETAFLLLIARRVLNHQRAAEADGETYTDLTPLAQLACGVRARARFQKAAYGYDMLVDLKVPATFSDDEVLRVASDILAQPAVSTGVTDGVLHFRRKDE